MRPFYIDGNCGRLFAMHFAPARDVARGLGVLIVPPFGEELNRCRRMIADQSKMLSTAGVDVLLVDLLGTGDSDGDFCDARWEVWRDDVLTGYRWLASQGCSEVVPLGIRSGALLAVDAIGQLDTPPKRLILWQPILSGKRMIDNLLRSRVVRSLGSGCGERETTASLRAMAAADGTIEIAGYELHADLIAAFDDLQLKKLDLPAAMQVEWFELNEQGQLSPASERIVGNWRANGGDVETRVIEGPAFWSLMDITTVPELLGETAKVIGAPTEGRAYV